MKKDLYDQDVIHLLEEWKEREVPYPSGLQDKRREAFLALGLSALPLGAGLAKAAGEATVQSTVHAASLPMTLGMKITLGFLSTLVVGLSSYLGITAYENRDALRDFLRGGTPTISLVYPSPYGIEPALATPAYLSTATPFATPSPTGTLIPTATNEEDPLATPTAPGLHLGQTKTPKPKPFK